ncbi:hypothetical protein H5410_028667 [Solanum commersonii]|uniref:Uncharacterized protein n=1 Tax=Solanum commersonii TaxID=4109 RepID=A0A9J5Z5K1_SOLCO|nr:hypothetical protein H5410_028667 [Solanum commersonii]
MRHTLNAERAGRLKQTYFLVSSKRNEVFFLFVFSYPIMRSSSNKQVVTYTLKIRGVPVSKYLASALKIDSNSVVADISGDTSKFELVATKDVILDIEKYHRGKGANRGGSIARQPHREMKKNVLTSSIRDGKVELTSQMGVLLERLRAHFLQMRA